MMFTKSSPLTVAAQCRIHQYVRFQKFLDASKMYEDQMEEYRRLLDSKGRDFYAFFDSWQFRPYVTVKLYKSESVPQASWIVEEFERIFGEVVQSADDAEFGAYRTFTTRHGTLRLEIPMDSVTCKRVATGEKREVDVYRIECTSEPESEEVSE